jgi:hypothetical protein
MRTRLLSFSLICALALVPAAPSVAKPPPRGKYDCVIGSNSILFGTLTIKKGGKYSHRGTKGTFTHGKKQQQDSTGLRFWRLAFKGGDLGGMKGRWYRASDGTPEGGHEIALRNPRDDFESIYCTKRK